MTGQEVHFSLQSNDIKTAMQLASLGTIPVPLPAILGVGAIVSAVAMYLSRAESNWVFDFLVPILVLLLIVVALFQYGVLPWQARQHARQSAAFRDEIAAHWDNEKFRLSGEHGQVEMAWSEFHRWSENKEMVLLYHSDIAFHVLPKSAFSKEQVIDIVTKLNIAGVKKR